MNKTFNSSITRGGDVITPDIITINDREIIWKKRHKNVISSDSISIPLTSVSSIHIDSHILGTTITITSQGLGEIIAENFTASDAKEIKSTIQSLQDSANKKQREQRDTKREPKKEYHNPQIETKKFEENKYLEPDRITTIEFEHSAESILYELNKLNTLLKTALAKHDKECYSSLRYKIEEGIALIGLNQLTNSEKVLYDKISNEFKWLRWRINFDPFLRHKWLTLIMISIIYVWIDNYFHSNKSH